MGAGVCAADGSDQPACGGGGDGCEELASWLERLRGSGVVKRMEPDPAGARALLERLVTVLAALPADGEPLGRFAARLAGGAHALDEGEPLATLALGAARALARPASPGSRRVAGGVASRGVGRCRIAVRRAFELVLTLGLPGEQATGSGRILRLRGSNRGTRVADAASARARTAEWAAAAGGSLSGQTVHICENPVVVALAADRLGAECPPLVCTSGQPGAATMLLLRALVAAGARLAHHGDFDWGGVRIGNVLHARLALVPWRFDTEAYMRAADSVASPQPLAGAPVPASWDPRLSETMRRVGRRIEEELVIEELLADLVA